MTVCNENECLFCNFLQNDVGNAVHKLSCCFFAAAAAGSHKAQKSDDFQGEGDFFACTFFFTNVVAKSAVVVTYYATRKIYSIRNVTDVLITNIMTVAMEPTIWENSTSVTKKSSDKGKNHTQIQRRNAAAIT